MIEYEKGRKSGCMLYIPHEEEETEESMKKKLKVVVESNRVHLHGKHAEQLHHPFSPINTTTSDSFVVREESCVECDVKWKWKFKILFYFFCGW